MRLPRIDLAYAKNIDSCLAIENHLPCLNNPRWIEEDWLQTDVDDLKHARNDIETHWDSFDHDHRVERSKALIRGQVCTAHKPFLRRLHQANMIRAYARGDLKVPRHSTRKANAGHRHMPTTRAAKKRAVRAVQHQTPEIGRAQSYDVNDPDTSMFLTDFGFTPRTTTSLQSDNMSPLYRTLMDSGVKQSSATPCLSSAQHARSTISFNNTLIQPITPKSAVQVGNANQKHVAMHTPDTELSSANQKSRDLTSLMHQSSHLQLQLDLDVSQFNVYRLTLENDHMRTQLVSRDRTISAQQKEIVAGKELAAMVRSFNHSSSSCLDRSGDY